MAEETKPLPCPWCGGEPIVECKMTGRSTMGSYAVYCNCGAFDHWDSEERAIAAWNTRSSQSIRDAAMAEGWREAQRWLVEIFELDAARKMDYAIKNREIGRAKGEAKP